MSPFSYSSKSGLWLCISYYSVLLLSLGDLQVFPVEYYFQLFAGKTISRFVLEMEDSLKFMVEEIDCCDSRKD